MESYESPEKLREKMFEEMFSTMRRTGVSAFTEPKEGVAKTDFLAWLVEKKGVLLHGSNEQSILELEPRLANCRSKEFGNMKAVYAIADPILPTFYAIRDKDTFRGTSRSGIIELVDDGIVTREYDFAVSRDMLEKAPWSQGAVYVLSKETFVQGHDDEGNIIDEWASLTPVVPIGKIKIQPNDFPYLHQIKALEEA